MASSSLVDGQTPEAGQGSWMLQSIMEMQKTQGQLVEAVQSLRESQRETQARIGSIARDMGTLSQQVTTLAQKAHTGQTVVWVVGVGLSGIVGLVGWLVTNAIAVLPSLLSPK
jgi:hypothetical protein